MKTNKDYYDLRFSSEELLMIDSALSNAGVDKISKTHTIVFVTCSQSMWKSMTYWMELSLNPHRRLAYNETLNLYRV